MTLIKQACTTLCYATFKIEVTAMLKIIYPWMIDSSITSEEKDKNNFLSGDVVYDALAKTTYLIICKWKCHPNVRMLGDHVKVCYYAMTS